VPKRNGAIVIAILVILLIAVHQDIWFWNDGTLVFGFIPIGLFYHACLSVAASVVWFLATVIAWPADLESATIEETSNTGDAS
jgi:hypothetical protein